MLNQAIDRADAALQGSLTGDWSWLARALVALLEFLRISVADPGGRYYWFTLVAAATVLAVVYVLWGGLRSGGVGGFW